MKISGEIPVLTTLQMAEVDRCNENRTLFVWYECSRNDCNGQWLQKMLPGYLNNPVLSGAHG